MTCNYVKSLYSELWQMSLISIKDVIFRDNEIITYCEEPGGFSIVVYHVAWKYTDLKAHTREYSTYRVVTTSRLKATRHLVVHDNLKTFCIKP